MRHVLCIYKGRVEIQRIDMKSKWKKHTIWNCFKSHATCLYFRGIYWGSIYSFLYILEIFCGSRKKDRGESNAMRFVSILVSIRWVAFWRRECSLSLVLESRITKREAGDNVLRKIVTPKHYLYHGLAWGGKVGTKKRAATWDLQTGYDDCKEGANCETRINAARCVWHTLLRS